MHISLKRLGSYIIAVLLFVFTAVCCCICLPHSAYASQLSTDVEPYLYFSYASAEDGSKVYGDTISAGTYDVSIVLEGLDSLCDLQITVDYTEDAVVESEPISLLSDEYTDFTTMGTVLGDGRIVIGFVSDVLPYSAVDPDGTVLAVFRATFSADYTAEQVREIFTVAQNPNVTFIQVNYNDDEDDAFAPEPLYEGYKGNLYPMRCEVFPINAKGTYTLSGRTTIANTPTGGDSGFPIGGIAVVADGVQLGISASDGTFSVEVPVGTTELTFTGRQVDDDGNVITKGTCIDRMVTEESVDRSDVVIPIIICDYNNDNKINSIDLSAFMKQNNSDATDDNVYYNLNGDTKINSIDFTAIMKFNNADIVYDPIIID